MATILILVVPCTDAACGGCESALTVPCTGREGGHGIEEYMNVKLIAFGGL